MPEAAAELYDVIKLFVRAVGFFTFGLVTKQISKPVREYTVPIVYTKIHIIQPIPLALSIFELTNLFYSPFDRPLLSSTCFIEVIPGIHCAALSKPRTFFAFGASSFPVATKGASSDSSEVRSDELWDDTPGEL